MKKLLLRARRRHLVLVLVLFLGAFLGCGPMAQAGFIVPSVLLTPGGPDAAPPLTSAAPGSLLAFNDSLFSFTTTAGRTSPLVQVRRAGSPAGSR